MILAKKYTKTLQLRQLVPGQFKHKIFNLLSYLKKKLNYTHKLIDYPFSLQKYNDIDCTKLKGADYLTR